MSKKQHSPQVYIGTSGWSYSHWKDNFYPADVKTNHWLNYYGEIFSTVEVNTTFYHLPLNSTIKNWYNQVPSNFLFSLKASRYITHQKRLNDCKNSVGLFFKVIKGLKSKTGPILFQLPPSLKINKERLIEFIELLDEDHKYTFEFRHPSWFVDDIYELLASKNIALCITDLNGTLTPEVITSDFTYLRLHGPKKAYQGSYGKAKLNLWKSKINKWALKTSVYCYFDNDEKGFAIQDAKHLQEFLNN